MSDYTQVDINTTGMTDDMAAESNQLETDINQLYKDMNYVKLSHDVVEDDLNRMSAQSGLQSGVALITTIYMLIDEANMISYALICITDIMNIISDCTNISTTGSNAYNTMVTNSTDDTAGEMSSSYFTDNDLNGDGWYNDEQTFNESVDLFLTTSITVTDANGNVKYATGVLDLLSNPDYWPMLSGTKTGAPMSTQTANLITTSLTGITDTFGDAWDSTSTDIENNDEFYYKETDSTGKVISESGIYIWSQPKAYPTTTTDGVTTTMYTTYTQNSDIVDYENSVDDQLTSASSTEQAYLQQGTTFYQQVQTETEQVMQSVETQNATMISNELA